MLVIRGKKLDELLDLLEQALEMVNQPAKLTTSEGGTPSWSSFGHAPGKHFLPLQD